MSRRRLIAATILFATTATSAGTIAPTAPVAQALENAPWQLPVRPPRCSTTQANSGDVAGCLLSFYGDPSDTGWGSPPSPGVGAGWSWRGHTYSGSAALDGWESTYIAANTEPVAGMGTGTLETHVAAQALFEGFLNEIEFKGYDVKYASGYSFRCTSGNGGWDCPSGDPDDLSNHAWGLAVDMNSGTNPIRRYSSENGVTACQTPMQTDFPQWAIESAERWGLYWGGYGWNSGCYDTDTERTSVYRDPPHFEFRGTPEQARSIAQFNLANDPTMICQDVADDQGAIVEACNRSGRPEAGWRTVVTVDAAEGTSAVMINLTATGSSGPGFLTLESCGPDEPKQRVTSALTFATGQSVATLALVPIDESGQFCIFRSTAVHSIVDVFGHFSNADEALWYEPSKPNRLIDTRLAFGPVQSRTSRMVSEDTKARIANVAVVNGEGPGYLQAGSCSRVGNGSFSNLNYTENEARSNLSLIVGEGEGSCVSALTTADVIVDELGTLTTGEGLGWELSPSRRALDTRKCSETWCDGRPGAGQLIPLDLGTNAEGAAIGITVTETRDPGFVTVGLCSDFEEAKGPSTSNLNHMKGTTVTNLALVKLNEGEMCIYTRASAHIIIDVQASIVTEQTTGLIPVPPVRIHDSRDH